MIMTEAEIKDFLSLFPDNLMVLSAQEQQVSLLLYRLLTKGSPVTLQDIAAESGIDLAEINEIISRWGSEVLWDKDKNINGFFGLNLSQTAHAIEVDN